MSKKGKYSIALRRVQIMYLVRKRFMYWHIPATIKIRLDKDREGAYCFVSVKLVKPLKEKEVVRFIVQNTYDPIAKTIGDRKVSLNK